MKSIINIIFLMLISVLLFSQTYSSKENILFALKYGNSKELSRQFASSIDLTINIEENVYSKSQAEIILKDFFSKNIPSDFKIIHQGAPNKDTEYIMGCLSTNKGTFRTYIYFKKISNKYIIHELSFKLD